jgi:proteic killer suppression protein
VINTVTLSVRAKKDLRICPVFIVRKFMAWVGAVQLDGLEPTRRLPGYHDEPLHGEWKGSLSIRLNRSYRAIYRIQEEGSLALVLVESVNKHAY